MKKFLVVGNPIAHSLSPKLHNFWFKKNKIEAIYEKKLLELCDGNKQKVNEIIVNLMKGVGASVENDKDLDKLISAVASKKGTTEAGLKSFKENKLNKVFEKGLKAAIKRSGEISNEY